MEQQAAAVKIQAAQRGKAARKETAARRAAAASPGLGGEAEFFIFNNGLWGMRGQCCNGFLRKRSRPSPGAEC